MTRDRTDTMRPPPMRRQRWTPERIATVALIVFGVIILTAAHAVRPYAFIHYCPSPLKVQRIGPTTTQVTCEVKP